MALITKAMVEEVERLESAANGGMGFELRNFILKNTQALRDNANGLFANRREMKSHLNMLNDVVDVYINMGYNSRRNTKKGKANGNRAQN